MPRIKSSRKLKLPRGTIIEKLTLLMPRVIEELFFIDDKDMHYQKFKIIDSKENIYEGIKFIVTKRNNCRGIKTIEANDKNYREIKIIDSTIVNLKLFMYQ